MRNTPPKTTMEPKNTFEEGETSTGFHAHPTKLKTHLPRAISFQSLQIAPLFAKPKLIHETSCQNTPKYFLFTKSRCIERLKN